MLSRQRTKPLTSSNTSRILQTRKHSLKLRSLLPNSRLLKMPPSLHLLLKLRNSASRRKELRQHGPRLSTRKRWLSRLLPLRKQQKRLLRKRRRPLPGRRNSR